MKYVSLRDNFKNKQIDRYMKKKLFLGTLAAILSLTMATAEAQPRMQEKLTEEEQLLDAMHRTITSEKLFGYVKQLSDPALEGRLAGSPGMAKAVEIVKGYYEAWGLQPAGDKGGYIQEFPHPCVEIQPGSTMEILIPTPGVKKGEKVWIRKGYDWADGWFAGGMSGNGDV